MLYFLLLKIYTRRVSDIYCSSLPAILASSTLKRLLTKEFHIVGCEVLQSDQTSWSWELYPGEFEDLSQCHLLTSKCELLPPRLKGCMSDIPPEQGGSQLSRETLQVIVP